MTAKIKKMWRENGSTCLLIFVQVGDKGLKFNRLYYVTGNVNSLRLIKWKELMEVVIVGYKCVVRDSGLIKCVCVSKEM